MSIMETVVRERQTETAIRKLDAHEIVDWIHRLENEVESKDAEIERLKTQFQRYRDSEARKYEAEIERLRAENDRLWRERNTAISTVRAWEKTLVIEGLPLRTERVTEWGPGEDNLVPVPTPTPRRLTEVLDEIERLREAVQKLLACPAIADEDFSDPEWGCEITREAEAFARAALAGKEET
jgi:regulator of replication initiation timing